MKLQDSNTQVLTGGLTSQVKQFTINATAKAFSILSSGLYTDKIKAILRELSCNAYDAHVAAKTQHLPFEVHLPNSFEPFLRISDFGPGLSEDDVYNLYTTYFQSSKTDSNDYIGALGLGSKSPFSYTQSFTVTSRFGGMRKVYSAFLTEEGLPSIVKMSEEEYDGPCGIDVQMSVKSSDFYTFLSKASEVYTYFPVTPRFTGNRVEVQKPEYTTKGTGWAIRKGYGDSGARAIQGVVAYPVPLTNDKEADDLLRLGVDLIFEIGELEVAASREALSMNKTTAKNLADRVKLMAKEIGSEITKSIEAAPTYWEAVSMYSEMIRNNAVRYAIKNIKVTWKGKDIVEYFDIKPDKYPNLRLYACERRGYGRGLVRELSSSYLNPKEHILVRNDLKRGSKGVLNRWMKQFAQPGQKYYLVSPGWALEADYDANPDIEGFLVDVGTPSEVKSLETMKSELPKTIKTIGNRAVRNVFQILDMSSYRWVNAWQESKDEDLEADTFYYIPTRRNIPNDENDESVAQWVHQVRTLQSIHSSLVRLGVLDKEDPIFNGSPRMMAELAKMDEEEREKWVNIMDLIKEVTVATPQDQTELQNASGVDLYGAGLNIPGSRDTLADVLSRIGINADNETIPAIAEIKNAYVTHFGVVALEAKHQIKSELCRMVGRTDYVIPRPRQVVKTNLEAICKKYSVIANAFSNYSDWKVMRQGVEFIQALTIAKMI